MNEIEKNKKHREIHVASGLLTSRQISDCFFVLNYYAVSDSGQDNSSGGVYASSPESPDRGTGMKSRE